MTVITAIPVGLITLIGFGMLGVPITIIVAPIMGAVIMRQSFEADKHKRQERESHILQKITADIPLTEQEKHIHADMIAQAPPKK
jgi:hypothetical protein